MRLQIYPGRTIIRKSREISSNAFNRPYITGVRLRRDKPGGMPPQGGEAEKKIIYCRVTVALSDSYCLSTGSQTQSLELDELSQASEV
jgi:hypothetical protein